MSFSLPQLSTVTGSKIFIAVSVLWNTRWQHKTDLEVPHCQNWAKKWDFTGISFEKNLDLKSIRWELPDYTDENQELIIFKGTVINESGGDIMIMKSKSSIWSLSIHTASQADNLSFIHMELLLCQTGNQI